jgi:Spy/CpxP family protein refolding chaperone
MKTLILALCFSVIALAQPPRCFFAWWDSPFARELNLSADQQNQIRNILRDYRKELIDERASVEKAEIDIQTAMEADSFDQTSANAALDKLVAARASMTRSFTLMGFKLRIVLTADQWKQVQQRARQGMRERGGQNPRNPRPMQQNRPGARRGMRSNPGAPTGQGPEGPGPDAPPPE